MRVWMDKRYGYDARNMNEDCIDFLIEHGIYTYQISYLSRGHPVLIDNSEAMKTSIWRIIIICKTECVIWVQPSVVSVSSGIAWPHFDGHVACLVFSFWRRWNEWPAFASLFKCYICVARMWRKEKWRKLWQVPGAPGKWKNISTFQSNQVMVYHPIYS